MPRATRSRVLTHRDRSQPYSPARRHNSNRETGLQDIQPTIHWTSRSRSVASSSTNSRRDAAENREQDNEALASDSEEEDPGDSALFGPDSDETDAEGDAEYLPSQVTQNGGVIVPDSDETDAEADSDATDAELNLDDFMVQPGMDDVLPPGIRPDTPLDLGLGDEDDVDDENETQNDHDDSEIPDPTQPVVENPTIIADDSVILIEDEPAAPEPVQNLPLQPKPSPKKKSPVKASPSLNETVDNEIAHCHICFENLKTDGAHEICALSSCGHLFGRECITKWVKMKKECPNCKKKTTKGQIKKIYPSSMPLVAEDTSEIEGLRKQVEEMSAANKTLRDKLNVSETELKITKESLKANEAIIHHLRMNRRTSNDQSKDERRPRHFPKFILRKEEKLIKETNQPGQKEACRLLAVDDPLRSTVLCATSISNQNTTTFSNFSHGICVLDIQTMARKKYVATHKQSIKDIEFNSGYLLTGSLDKSMKVIDLEASRITRSFETQVPVWSVTWNRGKQLVYGGIKASVLEFDVRVKTSKPTRTIKVPGGDYQQVHSLYFKNNGLLCGQYKMYQWVGLENTNSVSLLSQEEGNGMPFHVLGDNLLATFRNKPPQTKLSKLSFASQNSQEGARRLTNDVVNTFCVSHQHDKMLRDKLLNLDDHLVAACTNQQTGSLQLHDAHSGDLLQRFERAQNTILDCVQYRLGTTNYIAELDGRAVRFHEQQKM